MLETDSSRIGQMISCGLYCCTKNKKVKKIVSKERIEDVPGKIHKASSNAIYFVILARKFPALQDPIFDLFIDMEVKKHSIFSATHRLKQKMKNTVMRNGVRDCSSRNSGDVGSNPAEDNLLQSDELHTQYSAKIRTFVEVRACTYINVNVCIYIRCY